MNIYINIKLILALKMYYTYLYKFIIKNSKKHKKLQKI